MDERQRTETIATRVFTAFNRSPPRILSSVGKFIKDISPILLKLNVYFDTTTPGTAALFTLVADTAKMIVHVCIVNFDEYYRHHNMAKEAPWSTLMGLFTVLSSLVLIMEDRWVSFKGGEKRPWQCLQSAHALDYILLNDMCVSEKPIKSYTALEMVMAMRTLGTHWYKLAPEPQLLTYLYGLLHRACMLIAHPGPDTVHNMPEYRRDYDAKKKLYCVNPNLIRLLSMQTMRMLFLVELSTGHIFKMTIQQALPLEAEVAGIRRYYTDRVVALAGTREAKSELTVLFPRLMISLGDNERFVDSRGMERARPASIIMTVKAETQQAYSHLHQFMILPKIIELTRDEEPDYFDRWTRGEHAYVMLLKTYMMNIPLRSKSIDFFNDWLVLEIDLPVSIHEVLKLRDPIILQLFGKLHVYHQYKLYICKSIEHALAMWSHLILTEHNGILMQRNIASSLHELMQIHSFSQSASPSADVNKITAGMGDIVID